MITIARTTIGVTHPSPDWTTGSLALFSLIDEFAMTFITPMLIF